MHTGNIAIEIIFGVILVSVFMAAYHECRTFFAKRHGNSIWKALQWNALLTGAYALAIYSFALLVNYINTTYAPWWHFPFIALAVLTMITLFFVIFFTGGSVIAKMVFVGLALIPEWIDFFSQVVVAVYKGVVAWFRKPLQSTSGPT